MGVLLIDGHYYLYRSFFAIRGLTNSSGQPTNAIYGFLKALRKMVADLKPDLGAVIWDQGLPDRVANRLQTTASRDAFRNARPGGMAPSAFTVDGLRQPQRSAN